MNTLQGSVEACQPEKPNVLNVYAMLRILSDDTDGRSIILRKQRVNFRTVRGWEPDGSRGRDCIDNTLK
jgi:hypothetical protein